MYSKLKNLLKRSKLAFATSVLVLGLGVAGLAVTSAQSQTVNASTCDKVNIVYCGLSGSSANGYINSLQDRYTSNSSGHSASPTVNKNYTDVKDVFNYFGASTSIINGMNTTNTKVGTLYRDGHIVVDGKTVGSGATVAARFSVPGATNISGTNVYVRKTTSSFAQDKATVIVYFKDGKMVFGAMVNCGNAIDAKPVVPETPPVVTPPVVTPPVVTPPVVTPPVVTPPVVTPPTPEKPVQALTCVSLVPSPTGVKNEIMFTATALPVNGATINSYVFSFGDTKNETVTSTATTASIKHTYVTPGSYIATVTVLGSANGNPVSSTNGNCAKPVAIEVPPATECKPGIPIGDVRCNPCPYNPELPADSPECKAPEVMPATGPAGIAALFSATSAFGAISHRMFLKRRLR